MVGFKLKSLGSGLLLLATGLCVGLIYYGSVAGNALKRYRETHKDSSEDPDLKTVVTFSMLSWTSFIAIGTLLFLYAIGIFIF